MHDFQEAFTITCQTEVLSRLSLRSGRFQAASAIPKTTESYVRNMKRRHRHISERPSTAPGACLLCSSVLPPLSHDTSRYRLAYATKTRKSKKAPPSFWLMTAALPRPAIMHHVRDHKWSPESRLVLSRRRTRRTTVVFTTWNVLPASGNFTSPFKITLSNISRLIVLVKRKITK